MKGSVLMVMVAVVTGAAVHDSDCHLPCPYNNDPVCGSDGKTYANMCELESEKLCHNSNLTLAHKGECEEECPYGCAGVWEPVCGSDGKTYGNMCELDVAKKCYDPDLTLDHKGECEAADPDCPVVCNDNYDPVCGSDGKTYSNMCELEGEKLCHNSDLTYDHKGDCDTPCFINCVGTWDPVCGSDGKTYSNVCELDIAHECYDPDLTVDHKGECEAADPDCPVICTAQYDPVCGSDGKTYGNMCELEAEKLCHNSDLTLAHEGECESDCPRACFDNWDPVCGNDGKTYPNQCELEAERDCNGKPDLALDHNGECTSTRRH